jgi:hypothetical protein
MSVVNLPADGNPSPIGLCEYNYKKMADIAYNNLPFLEK